MNFELKPLRQIVILFYKQHTQHHRVYYKIGIINSYWKELIDEQNKKVIKV